MKMFSGLIKATLLSVTLFQISPSFAMHCQYQYGGEVGRGGYCYSGGNCNWGEMKRRARQKAGAWNGHTKEYAKKRGDGVCVVAYGKQGGHQKSQCEKSKQWAQTTHSKMDSIGWNYNHPQHERFRTEYNNAHYHRRNNCGW